MEKYKTLNLNMVGILHTIETYRNVLFIAKTKTSPEDLDLDPNAWPNPKPLTLTEIPNY